MLWMVYLIEVVDPLPMGALIVHDDVLEVASGMLELHESLVWYARKDPDPNGKMWENVPADIKAGAFEQLKKMDADETIQGLLERLRDPESGDWNHGFNSGMLAGLRFFFHAAADLDEALEMFPELDT